MVDEIDQTPSLRLSFIGASFFVAVLFASWYRRDPLVSPTPSCPSLALLIDLGVSQLDAIPTVGFSDPILSYFSAFRFIFDGLSRLKYGYEKTRRGLFKTAAFRRWMVLASGPELIEDVRKAPDDVLSITASAIEFLQAEYTLDLLDITTDYHTDVIRAKLTRNIAATFKDVRDELIRSLDASIPVHDDDWVKVPVLETMQHVVSATTNRVFVGFPLCRNQDYLTLNLNYAVNVMKFATIIGMFPKPLKPIVARILSNLPSQIQQEMEFIRPLVEERFARMDEFGEDWDDKPVRRSTSLDVNVVINAEVLQNDMLMWLMSEAKGVERSLEGLARRMLAVNCAAIHTTSTTFTNVLYRLLSNPEYVEPLRHDVEIAIAEEGWTKAGLDKMHKIDSFLRETQRLDSLDSLTLLRLALRPFTFSNGVTVPAGTLIAAPTGAINRDGDIFPNPEEFDGFRFTKPRDDGNAMAGRQALSMSPDNLAFGYGRHACPGRFFAVSEVKAFLAHVVVTYDVKFEEGKQAPLSLHIGSMRMPGKANAMFRKRQR
ncbi:cytochrome P450 [Lactarius akahatsu]|uniref:Cytochrome P450 n=1 Tax=Lactarius akahatsu TaxID=416441 RepID=A0AAD4QDI6_9AGAM|nr:cytochrome P450 [Lactarius akahatsu]